MRENRLRSAWLLEGGTLGRQAQDLDKEVGGVAGEVALGPCIRHQRLRSRRLREPAGREACPTSTGCGNVRQTSPLGSESKRGRKRGWEFATLSFPMPTFGASGAAGFPTLFSMASGVSGLIAGPFSGLRSLNYRVRPLSSLELVVAPPIREPGQDTSAISIPRLDRLLRVGHRS